MRYIAQEDILNYKKGQEVPIHSDIETWVKKGHVKAEGEEKSKVVEPIDFDLNRDGKVDKEDVTIAAKLLGKTRAKKRRK